MTLLKVPLKKIEFLPLALLLIANALFLNWNAFRGFNFFDMGAFLDASWRVYIGQMPYRDFIYISGPGHLYMNALFFLIFGFGKMAILMHIILIHSIVILATYFISRKYSNPIVSFLTAILTTTCFYWSVSHPWHDQSAHFWGILAVVFFYLLHPISTRSGNIKLGITCGILSAFSFFTKTNIGLAYTFVLFVTFFSSSNRISLLIGFISGGLAIVLVALFLFPFNLYIDQAFLMFDSPSYKMKRTFYLLYIPTWFENYYWIVVLLVLASIRNWTKEHLPQIILFFGMVFVAQFSMATGQMKHTANMPLTGIVMALAFNLFTISDNWSKSKQLESIRKFTRPLLFVITLFLIGITAKRGISLDTWAYGTLNPVGDYAMTSEKIKGWRTDRESGEAVDAIVEFLNQNAPKTDSVLVLTDLQILYPLTSRESFKGITFTFFDNDTPPPGQKQMEVHNSVINHPPVWIVTQRNPNPNSFTSGIIPYLGLKEFVIDNYMPVFSKNNYLIWRRK